MFGWVIYKIQFSRFQLIETKNILKFCRNTCLSIEALEQTMKNSGEEIKAGGQAADTKVLVSASLNASRNGSEFRANLREKGINLMLRYGNGGRLFGATFIDHNSGTVLNGSALGKEFSANALATRFADFSTASRKDQQPVPSTPAKKHYARPCSMSRKTSNRLPSKDIQMMIHPSAVCFRLTPEPDQRDDNEPMPKKRRYGR